jgi:hypothetical protein
LGLGQQGFLGGFWTGGTLTSPVVQNGSVDGSAIGANVPSSGSFTTLASSGVASLSAGGSFKGTFTSLGGAILTAFLIQGGFIDGAPIGNSTPSSGKFTTLNASGASTFTGTMNANGALNVAGGLSVLSGDLELGSLTSAFNPVLDFHSSGTNIDYDSRITANGGTGVLGAGSLFYFAANHIFDHRPVFAGAFAWDAGNLPHPAQTTGITMSGTLQTAGVQVLAANTIQFLSQGNTYGAFMRADATGFIGFLNGVQSAWNVQVFESGVVSFPRARPNWAGLTPWDNGNLTALSQLANNVGYVTAGATVAGANSVNGITFAIAGQGGQPPWLWGYPNGNQQLLYNPSNFSVNFANSAGSVNGVSAPATRGAVGSSTGIGAEIGPLVRPSTTASLDAPQPWVVGGVRVGAWAGPSGDCVQSLYVRLTQVQQA